MEKLEALQFIINKRQSIFPNSFTGEQIDDSKVDLILQLANKAPTHRLVEPWRFHVIKNETKKSFTEFLQSTYKEEVLPENFNQRKYDKFSSKVDKTSHIICISFLPDANKPVPEWENIAATACAIQNIYLTVTALGLGGYWSSPSFFIKNAPKFLSMQEGEKSLGMFYLGVPKEELPPPIIKGDYKHKVSWY